MVGATLVLYKIDVRKFHKETDGLFGSLGILVLIFFIPIITFINFYILEFVRNRAIKK
ncbi:hypothetical protein [Lederbergia citrea]|uniref:hypothetical protein n=1 Tax=Lederbergia citrea TaxID=2833581 RepID=UPI001BC9695C|nr:hypothetical protein [Lederbergia citrea]MBS4179420.1 hypothetical protein [Lederbergia citrea]